MEEQITTAQNTSITEIRRLTGEARRLAANSKSPATLEKYRQGWQVFYEWAIEHELDELPARVETIILYITHLNERNLRPSTITLYLTAISQMHELQGYPSPTKDPRVREIMKGIMRVSNRIKRQANPISLKQLREMIDMAAPDVIGRRDRVLLLLGWFAALRRSEIVAIQCSDVEFCDDGAIVTLRRSKTDQVGEGRKIAIPYIDNVKYCAAVALRNWIEYIGGEGPVAISIGKRGKNRFFIDRTTGALSRLMVTRIVKKYIDLIGGNSQIYSSHSLRAGFATWAARVGVPERDIMRQTGHTSLKTMREYIRDGELFRDHPLKRMLDATLTGDDSGDDSGDSGAEADPKLG